jgi:hypothetical protein
LWTGNIEPIGHTIVDDEFLFVNDGSIRLWEHRIRGNHLMILMITDSWTFQEEMSKSLSGTYPLFPYMVLFTSIKNKANFCRNTCNQRYKKPQTTSTILFGVH